MGCQIRWGGKMSSTYLSLHYHLVFSTKNRLPLIKVDWQDRLHKYLGGVVNGLNGIAEAIGGVSDHVHLLVGLKATHSLSDFMQELKKSSSVWAHTELGFKDFAWQEGYSAFTVSASVRDKVTHYITNQAEHHRVKSFKEELIELLAKAQVQYDSKYFD
jgi:putative transposase